MMKIALVIIGWIACGLLGGGMWYSYFQHAFPSIAEEERRLDASRSIFFSFFGPFTLIIGFFATGFAQHGIWRSYRGERG